MRLKDKLWTTFLKSQILKLIVKFIHINRQYYANRIFEKKDSFDQCPLFKISIAQMPDDLASDPENVLVEWALKKVSIPDNGKTSIIHLETVWVVTHL